MLSFIADNSPGVNLCISASNWATLGLSKNNSSQKLGLEAVKSSPCQENLKIFSLDGIYILFKIKGRIKITLKNDS